MSKISTDKISVQMYTLRDHTQTKNDLSSTLKRLADMGFKNVQYSLQNFLTADEAKELLSNYGLKNDSPYCADLYNFDADNIVAGEYEVTFATEGYEYKVDTTDKYEVGDEVGLTFTPEDIHVMSVNG